jgi:hypothetical protein
MKMIDKIDLRNTPLIYVSQHITDGEKIHQIVFENTVIVVNEEQMNRIVGISE